MSDHFGTLCIKGFKVHFEWAMTVIFKTYFSPLKIGITFIAITFKDQQIPSAHNKTANGNNIYEDLGRNILIHITVF